MLRGGGVADTRQKIGYGICLHNALPARFRYARNFSLERHATETNSAPLELADVSARAAANTATVASAELALGLLQGLANFCCTHHLLCRSFFTKRDAQAL